ncbi:MAG: ATP-binding cassette domain-containing protein [Limnohabitans sp.]|jgi:ATP-binding cassette subfamily C protein LapB|uniref:ATP-binding cassette domain-containing protein n=1 Tax=Limnohabitans sp. TaxID=1907725 RepID=UPI00391904F0
MRSFKIPLPDLVELQAVLMRLAQLRREPVDVLALHAALRHLPESHDHLPPLLDALAQLSQWPKPQWAEKPDEGRLPCVVISPEGQLGIITARTPEGLWATNWWLPESRQFAEKAAPGFSPGHVFVRMRMTAPFFISQSPSLQLIWTELRAQKRGLLDIAAGTIAISLLALATSFYTMQVYDRVVPTQATATLWVLSIGVLLSVLLETFGKWLRSKQIHSLTDAVDQNLARSVYGRFLSVRLDQVPASVGATSSRLRSYESIRAFLLSLSTQAMVDIPLALFTLGVLALIGGWLALVPGMFLVLGLLIGIMFHNRMDQLAKLATPAQHQKSGLLVESIEGAETIKSGQGGWRMLSKWLDITDESRQHEQSMRQLTEMQQLLVTMFQQIAYVGLVAAGALVIGHADFTMGALIACSILSGRILAPIATIPALIMQWAQTRVSLQDLDRLWALQLDHPPGTEPIVIEPLRGQYELIDIQMSYNGTVALNVKQLRILAGEKVAILGGIGSGKTSMLRLLSGMYKAGQGRALLDGIDLDHIAKGSLAHQIGFVPQDGRLFAGTLRDNLVLGMNDPGDDALLQAARETGLFEAVIAAHPKGIAREIFEGGQGLSGGQRQLVHITRSVLRNPRIWLLDEPTASMDSPLENHVIQTLQNKLRATPQTQPSTLVLVTHKPQLLVLVQRIIVMANQQVILDGPRDQVLQQLQAVAAQAHKAKKTNISSAGITP